MIAICLDCLCHEPSNTHHDARHITLADIERAAAANGIGRLEAAERILAEVKRATQQRMIGTTVEESGASR